MNRADVENLRQKWLAKLGGPEHDEARLIIELCERFLSPQPAGYVYIRGDEP